MFVSKNTIAGMLLASASLASVSATPIQAEQLETNTEIAERDNNCVVNSAYRDSWVENGLTRWRTVFSSVNTDPDYYCTLWSLCTGALFSDKDCQFDPKVDGGSWRVDISVMRGAGGDNAYWRCLGQTRDEWVSATGCRTG